MMTSKERVVLKLTSNHLDRVPRYVWELPGENILHLGFTEGIRHKFEMDIMIFQPTKLKLPQMRGDKFKPGIY